MDIIGPTSLEGYKIVALADENILNPDDELDGCFTWVVYCDDNSPTQRLYFGRCDNISGNVREIAHWPYADAGEYVASYTAAIIMLWERATGRDFHSACPVR